MKRVVAKKKRVVAPPTTLLLATSVPSTTINYHTGECQAAAVNDVDLPQTDTAVPESEQRYLGNAKTVAKPTALEVPDMDMPEASLPFQEVPLEEVGAFPAYATTAPCNEKGAKKRQARIVFKST